VVVLLRIGDATMERRLADPRRDNVFGTTGDTVAWSRTWRERVELELRGRDAYVVDARRPVDEVVDEVIGACAAHGCPISST
jgi:hypothetical protein